MTLPTMDQPVAERIPSRLRALILLGGSVRPTQLHQRIGRSILDLPVDGKMTILQHWQQQVHELVEDMQLGELIVRVVIDRDSAQPNVPVADASVAISIERDPTEFRGTGGILRDLTAHYEEDDFILVANASQVMLQPLSSLLHLLVKRRADVSLISHQDGGASSLILVRCGCLRDLPAVGFIDFKEQALAKIAVNHTISVIEHPMTTALPIRTRNDYIAACLQYQRRMKGNYSVQDPFAEDWAATFAVVEDGAHVDQSARVHDSVVMKGAKLEANALVVRSVVCAGALVRSGEMVVDEIVTAQNRVAKGGEL